MLLPDDKYIVHESSDHAKLRQTQTSHQPSQRLHVSLAQVLEEVGLVASIKPAEETFKRFMLDYMSNIL